MRLHKSLPIRLVLLFPLLLLSGCAFLDSLNAPRDVAGYEKALADAQATSAALHAQLDALQATFASTNDEKVKAGIATIQSGLAKVDATIPVLNDAIVAAKAAGKTQTTLWALLSTVAIPYAIPFLRGIPVVGPIVEPLAEGIWSATATARQKALDADAHAALAVVKAGGVQVIAAPVAKASA